MAAATARAPKSRHGKERTATSQLGKTKQLVRIAIIICNWNGGEHILRCLESVAQQTYANFRVIVVDNGSTDGSAQTIELQFPAVHIIRNYGNLGFARAINIGLSHVKDSELVALLNPDAFPEREWLEKLLAASEDHPECASIGSRLVRASNPDVLDGIGDVYHVSGLHWREGHGKPADKRGREAKEIFAPCAAAALYRVSAIREAGGFDEDYFCYGEDVDLGFRMRLLGYRAWYEPRAVAHHIGSAATGSRSDFSVYHGYRNGIWTFLKNMPGVLLWACLPAHLLGLLMLAARLSLRGQGAVVLCALRDAVAALPCALKKRRRAQAMRRATVRYIWSSLDKSLPGFRR